MLFLGCPLSGVSPIYDLELTVGENVEWSYWLPGAKWICAGAVSCW